VLAAGETPPAKSGEVRLLGAIVPVGDGRSYFVKLVGPADRVGAVEKEFDAFLASVRIPGDGGRPISWTPPPGGREARARQMRLVTYALGPPGASVDLYVSDPFSGTLLDNVNRWRKQDVGLPAVTEAELPSVTREVQLGGTKAYRVDFRGPGGTGGMGGPFMQGGR
jgi:hypothetical protein